MEALVRLIESEPTDGVLVFVKMRSTTEPVAERLTQAGIRARALNGDVPQKQRERIVDGLRRGHVDVIVATDVAARGLDVERVSHVINYDVPFDSEAYVHRIGRTGRAGREGDAILFLDPREQHLLKRLEKATRHTIEQMEMPSVRAVNKKRVAAFHQRISDALERDDLEVFESIIHQFHRGTDLPLEKVAAALAALANDENPLLVKEELKTASFIDRKSRSEKGRRGNSRRRFGGDMVTYRVEAGRRHRIEVKHLVGALVNGAGIDKEMIGKIRVFDQFSTVDLSADVTGDMLQDASALSIGNRSLRLTEDNGPGGGRPHAKRGGRHGGRGDYQGHKPRKSHRKGKRPS